MKNVAISPCIFFKKDLLWMGLNACEYLPKHHKSNGHEKSPCRMHCALNKSHSWGEKHLDLEIGADMLE